jgi:excisionase family DNA binding protein
METDKLMTAKQVSEYLGVAKLTLQNWRTTGTPVLPFIKIGRVVRYSELSVMRFLEEKTLTKC